MQLGGGWRRGLSDRCDRSERSDRRVAVAVAVAAWALALLLLGTGTMHFVSPSGFESIVPGFLGSPAFWVALSGVAELGCAVLLVVPRTRRVAGWACVVLFVIVYPANIKMAIDSVHGQGSALIAWLRLPLQIPLVLWALYIARHAAPTRRTAA